MISMRNTFTFFLSKGAPFFMKTELLFFRVILNTLKSSLDNNKQFRNIQNILLITLERAKLPFCELGI